MFRLILCVLVSMVFVLVPTGCGPTPLDKAMRRLDDRPEWKTFGKIDVPRHPAEKHLAGMVIVLDPGHGGDAHLKNYKRGPTGVREAEMNWRVAKLLERLLVDCGVHVTLTRHGDEEVSLADRAKVANEVVRPDGGKGADLFISLHHNASSRESANFSSVWYHGEADWSERSLDVSKYIAHHLGSRMRTNIAVTSPLLSDQLMYESGFGVLQACEVPALLCESSFFTNYEEEQRLRDADYNLREAYAIYLGLCEYAYGGMPTQSLPAIEKEADRLRVTTVLDDGLDKGWWGSDRDRSLSSTISVTLDGRRIPSSYDPAKKTVEAEVLVDALLKRNKCVISFHHANMFKHHNYPQRYELRMQNNKWLASPIGPQRAE